MFAGMSAQDVYNTYEKLRLEISISMELDKIQNDISQLSKVRHKLPKADLFDRMRGIVEDIEKVQRVVVSLSERRHSSIRMKLVRARGLLPKKVTYQSWRNYIMTHMQILYESLDEMKLLLTDVPYDQDWSDDFFYDALTKTHQDAQGTQSIVEED